MTRRGRWVPRVPYRFSHRAGDRYYWSRPATNGYEEQVSCNVAWFWGRSHA